jgi:hypothetical protein
MIRSYNYNAANSKKHWIISPNHQRKQERFITVRVNLSLASDFFVRSRKRLKWKYVQGYSSNQLPRVPTTEFVK